VHQLVNKEIIVTTQYTDIIISRVSRSDEQTTQIHCL